MKLLAVASLVAAAAAAASTTTAAAATSTCAAENILQACLQTENDLLASCGTNDWDCKCNAYGAIVTCYNNCPNDAGKYSAQGQQQIFCGYASQYPSSTPAAAATATKTGTTDTAAGTATGTTAATGTTTATAAKGTSTGTSTSTSASAATATANAAAADLVFHAGGLLVAVAGMVAAAL